MLVAAILCAAVTLLDPVDAWTSHGTDVPHVTAVRPEQLRRWVDDPASVAIVDLRETRDYQAGHLPGAISLPLSDLERRHIEIPTGRRLVLYCDCPSDQLVSVFLFLRSKGYANVAILEDGFAGWIRRRYPIAH